MLHTRHLILSLHIALLCVTLNACCGEGGEGCNDQSGGSSFIEPGLPPEDMRADLIEDMPDMPDDMAEDMPVDMAEDMPDDMPKNALLMSGSMFIEREVFTTGHIPEDLHMMEEYTSSLAAPAYQAPGVCEGVLSIDGEARGSTRWEYDGLGRKLSAQVMDRGAPVLRRVYEYAPDLVEPSTVRVITVTESGVSQSTWRMALGYDEAGRVARLAHFPFGQEAADARGLTFEYDEVGRPLRIGADLPRGAFGEGVEQTRGEWAYDVSGDVFLRRDASQQRWYGWDAQGLPTTLKRWSIERGDTCAIADGAAPLGECDAQGRLTRTDSVAVTYVGEALRSLHASWPDAEGRSVVLELTGTRCWVPQSVLLTIATALKAPPTKPVDGRVISKIFGALVNPNLAR